MLNYGFIFGIEYFLLFIYNSNWGSARISVFLTR